MVLVTWCLIQMLRAMMEAATKSFCPSDHEEILLTVNRSWGPMSLLATLTLRKIAPVCSEWIWLVGVLLYWRTAGLLDRMRVIDYVTMIKDICWIVAHRRESLVISLLPGHVCGTTMAVDQQLC